MTTAQREAPPVAPETLDEARRAVAGMLSQSDAFRMLDPETRAQIAGDTAAIAAVLADPAHAQAQTADALAAPREGQFTAQGAREGAAVAGALLQAVDFPTFVAKLVEG